VAARQELAAGGEVERWGWYSGGRRGQESSRLASGRGEDAQDGDNRGRGELVTRVPR
jgi:hypothetical protein